MSRESKKKKTKKSINKHAILLFKQKGFEKVTVEEITVACGIAKGTFFNYFPKKEHLLLYITDTYMERLQEILQKHQDGSFLERIKAFFSDLLVIYQKHAAILGLILQETIRNEIHKEMKQSNVKNFEWMLTQFIEQEKRAGHIPSKWDSPQIAAMLAAVFLHSLIIYGTEKKGIHLLEQQLDFIWEGISHE